MVVDTKLGYASCLIRNAVIMSDLRQYAPATERNRQPILEVLSQFLPKTGNILEISSGTGEHAVFFCPSSCSLSLDSLGL